MTNCAVLVHQCRHCTWLADQSLTSTMSCKKLHQEAHFANPRWQMAATLKILNCYISATAEAIAMKFCMVMAQFCILSIVENWYFQKFKTVDRLRFENF